MKHNDWTEQLRQRLNDAQVPAPENLWDRISKQLDAEGKPLQAQDAQVAKKPRRMAWMPWAAAASVVLIAGVGMWWQLRSNAPNIAMHEPTPRPIALTSNKAASADASALTASTPTHTDKALALSHKPSALSAINEKEVAALSATECEALTEPVAKVAAITEDEPAPATTASTPATTTQKSQRSARPLPASTTYAQPRTQRTGTPSRWQVGVGTAGNMNRYESSGPIYVNSLAAVNMNYADNDMFRVSPYEQDTKAVTHHDMPISIGLTAAYSLTSRMALSSGLVYTLATSSFQHGASMPKEEQTLHYVGIPLNLSYTIWGNNWLRTYVMAGAQADMNVKATLKADGHTDNIDNDRAQFSVTGGAGVQFNVAQQLGVYIEPGVRYYFDNGSAVQTIFKEHPTNFSLQVGLRWNIE